MFYDIVLLSPQYRGEFSVAWIAATRGIKYVSKKHIESTNIEKLCNDIMAKLITTIQVPKARLSLSLSARLINGTIKIFHQKTLLLQKSLNDYLQYVSHPCKPGPVDKRRNKKKPVLSNEVKCPIKEAALPELQLTDRDVEKALQDAPSVAIDSITLRDEIPRRTMPFEEEGGFGDERCTVDLRPHVEEVNKAESESRKEILDAVEILSLEEISKIKPVEDTESKRPQTPKKRKLPEMTEKESSITLQEPVRKRPGKVIKHKTPADTKKELCIRPEEEARKDLEMPEEESFIKPDKPARKKFLKRNKVFVKSRKQPSSKLMRHAYLQDEDEIYTDYDLTIDLTIFKNINEEWDDMLPKSARNISLGKARAQESWSSQISGNSLLRKSHDTPASVRDERNTAGTSRQIQLVDGDVLMQTPIQTEEVLRYESVYRERVIEEVTNIEIPLQEEILLQEKEISPEEAIIPMQEEEISPQEVAIRLQEREIPLQKEDLPVHAARDKRIQDIVRIVGAWSFAARDLTVEDVCIKPLNRLNVAITFNDLLCKLENSFIAHMTLLYAYVLQICYTKIISNAALNTFIQDGAYWSSTFAR